MAINQENPTVRLCLNFRRNRNLTVRNFTITLNKALRRYNLLMIFDAMNFETGFCAALYYHWRPNIFLQ